MRRSSNQIDRSPDDLLRLPRFDERTVAIRWHHEWFDGPLDGTIRYEAKDFWFSFYCDTGDPMPRTRAWIVLNVRVDFPGRTFRLLQTCTARA